jgi:Zn-dependent protease with chaperone function
VKNVFTRDRSELAAAIMSDRTSRARATGAAIGWSSRMNHWRKGIRLAHASCSRCMEPMRLMSALCNVLSAWCAGSLSAPGLPMPRVYLIENPQLNAFAATRGMLRWPPRRASLTVDEPRQRDRP